MIDSVITVGISTFSAGTVAGWLLRRRLDRIIMIWKNRQMVLAEETPKLVVVARSDLNLSVGKLASQVAHAAVSCYAASKKHNPKFIEFWETVGQPKIVVRCHSESALMKLAHEAGQRKLVTSLIKDAGKTQIPAGTVTVLGIGPAPARIVNEVTGHCKVY